MVASLRHSRAKPRWKGSAALETGGAFLLIALACLLCIGPASASAKVVNKVVAVVNDEIVTMYDLQSRLEMSDTQAKQLRAGGESNSDAPLRKKVLQAMINDILLLQEAERLGIDAPENIVQKRIERIKKEQGLTDEEFDALLEEKGLSRSDYLQRLRKQIKKNRLLQTMVRDKVLVTKDEIDQYYQKHKQQYRVPEKMRLKILVMGDRDGIERIRKRIVEDSLDFEQAAKEFSQGPGASQGGDLGYLRWEELQSRWKRVLSGVQPGQLTPVFQLGQNYAVLLLDSIRSGEPSDLGKVQDKIRNQLYSQKLRARYDEYLSDLRSKAVIDVRL